MPLEKDHKIFTHDSEAGVNKYSHLPGLKSQIIAIFVKPPYSELDIILTVSVWCMCMHA